MAKREIAIALLICALTGGVIAYKVYALGYSMTTVESEDGYFVRLAMSVKGAGQECDIHLTLPIQSDRQTIEHETQVSDAFKFTISPGRIGRWQTRSLDGEEAITYSFLAKTEKRGYAMPVDEDIPTTYSVKLQNYLIAEERIQTSDEAIRTKAFELAPPGTGLTKAVEAAYNYCYRDVRYLEIRGPTDALTALRLGEASCNGKNRLLVALLRARGIPARLANGLILEKSRKRTTHAWSEAWVVDAWVPLCPTNGHFAEIPEDYLELAKGDVPVITHSKHVTFDWKWIVRHQMNRREKAVISNVHNPLNIFHFWVSLKDYNVSLDLIMVILTVPIAATVVAFARNIVGVVPFGTFMPALIAVAFRDTGFVLGAGMFTAVILICSFMNMALLKLRILHIPRLVVIMTTVVISILGLSIVCIKMGLATGAAVSLYPMAIVSLTSERFTQMIMTDGWREAARRLLTTFLVAGMCYLVINWQSLQVMLAAFPELLLVNIALNIVIGSWTGLRLTEYGRFSALMRREAG